MKFCQIGAGRVGEIHATNIQRAAGCELAYVVDIDESVARRLADKLATKTSSLEEALSDQSVDAVCIATSTTVQADIVEAAAEAGKAIFCEKPVALSQKRIEECLSVISNCGVPFAVGFGRRFDPQMAAFKKRLDKGEIGKVEQLFITSREPQMPSLDILRSSGGLFRDMMIQDFDTARWLLGENPTEVYAAASVLVDPTLVALGDVDSAITTLKTRSGKLVQINNSRRAAFGFDQRIEALGSGGMLEMRNQVDDAIILSNAHGVASARPVQTALTRYREAFRLEIEAFTSALREGKPPQPGGIDIKAALRLADAAVESMETGKPVTV